MGDLADLAVVPVGGAEQGGRGRVAVGDALDVHGYENPMDSPLDLVQSIETQGLTAEIGGNSVWNFGLVLLRLANTRHHLPGCECLLSEESMMGRLEMMACKSEQVMDWTVCRENSLHLCR